MVVAGIDLGRRRIGLALCGDSPLPPRPLVVIERRSIARDLAAIANALGAFQVERLVVGLPLNMDGSEGPQAAYARRFTKSLAHALALPVDLQDERLTTFEARERQAIRPTARRCRKAPDDALAAAVILEDWLSSKRCSPDARLKELRRGDESFRDRSTFEADSNCCKAEAAATKRSLPEEPTR